MYIYYLWYCNHIRFFVDILSILCSIQFIRFIYIIIFFTHTNLKNDRYRVYYHSVWFIFRCLDWLNFDARFCLKYGIYIIFFQQLYQNQRWKWRLPCWCSLLVSWRKCLFYADRARISIQPLPRRCRIYTSLVCVYAAGFGLSSAVLQIIVFMPEF